MMLSWGFVFALVCLHGVQSACYPSPCDSLQNRMDALVMDNKDHIRLWCEVAVPYTGCLNKLPLDCRTTRIVDVIAETKYQMEQMGCGSSGELTSTISLFILTAINTLLL
ncbi:uncharacterized protein [Haliotis cracherodii]|uniref:uncharacterized protein n=1 Tax=Haliotis cracherodii TaxID=6455 RepID=UPI0039E87485